MPCLVSPYVKLGSLTYPTSKLVRNDICITFEYRIGLNLRKSECLGHTGEVELLGESRNSNAEPSGLVACLASIGSSAKRSPSGDEGLCDVSGKSNCSTGIFQTVNVSFPKLLL